ncbi:protein kinase domain-containing protein [Pseudomonas frederiksbergensis]|jgi:serine/threonine protein kinase|uniref:Protein kinase domain-containing protein n=1 Tax=Pseudomonas frederiksbergensis TaxID=104087 RepID=A0A0B1ZAR9_9PSED|nr:hypothetical protein [Pseudomonas frederiksbergensis]KHK66453.1 hypothetical protein JZ00_01070 [Pseudomonas frederiksbergensis]
MNAAARFKKDDILAEFPEIDSRYTLIGDEAIGEISGFGAVWRAQDNWIDSTVAIKFSEHKLSDEVRLCREIDGETARVFDFYKGVNGWEAYTMEHLEKPWSTLSSFIEKRRYKKSDIQFYFECFEILRAILHGLSSMHGKPYQRGSRVIHADIKPGNIFLLNKRKKRPHTVFTMPAYVDMVKLIDLGVSTYRGGKPIGYTPAYRPPQMNSVGSGFDLYAVAITFAELITKQRPMHENLKNPAAIRRVLATRSSGSFFMDELAVEIIKRCKNAATQSTHTAEKLITYLDSKLFDREHLGLMCLRELVKSGVGSGTKDELAEAIYPTIAKYWGWERSSAKRKAMTNDFVDTLVEEGFVRKSTAPRRFVVANGAS